MDHLLVSGAQMAKGVHFTLFNYVHVNSAEHRAGAAKTLKIEYVL